MNVGQRQRKRAMSEINVVPYIDVMLVLLVIFMITTPLLSQGVTVDLPQAKAQAVTTEEQEPLIISVDKQGLYYLNVADNPEAPMDANAITTRVAAELQIAKQQNKPRQVFVKGDQSVNYGKVVEAMVLLQQAGAVSVGLITQQPENT